MIGESKNWYKVEVNEATQAVKFILKSDPHWEKTTWNFWLTKIEVFYIDNDTESKIYDKPNGKLIENTTNSKLRYLRYLDKTEGDWAYVQAAKNTFCYPIETKNEQCYPGWIRWRDGRNILVKHYQDMFNLTDIETAEK